MKKKYLIIIPARAGSKRIKNKNIVKIKGIPLIQYTINYAKKFRNEIDVVINTDCKSVEKIAKTNSIEVYKRPEHLCGDFTATSEVLKEQIINYKKTDRIYDAIILLQPTNPIRPLPLLKNCIIDFEKYDCQELLTITPLNKKFGLINNKNIFTPVNYKPGQRSQELNKLYFENGLIYISSLSSILSGKIISSNSYSHVINHYSAHIDIDEETDLNLLKEILN